MEGQHCWWSGVGTDLRACSGSLEGHNDFQRLVHNGKKVVETMDQTGEEDGAAAERDRIVTFLRSRPVKARTWEEVADMVAAGQHWAETP